MLPTSLDRLLRHRAEHDDGPESRRVWLFHSHTYFDHTRPASVEAARAFRGQIQRAFTATEHVQVHALVAKPAGPHPCGSFEVLFTREAFAEYVSWLMFARPVDLPTLVHPLTGAQRLDHSARALWLGTPLALDHGMLEAIDARTGAAGTPEVAIIEGTKTH